MPCTTNPSSSDTMAMTTAEMANFMMSSLGGLRRSFARRADHAAARAPPGAPGPCGSLVAFAPDLRPRFPDQEIEVNALIGLLHRLAVELHPAAISVRRLRLPLRAPFCELGCRNLQVDRALR